MLRWNLLKVVARKRSMQIMQQRMSSSKERYYDILKLPRNATDKDIKKAFRKLALEHHPDKGGDAAVFQDITSAYNVLSDDTKRNEYDKKLLVTRSTDGLNNKAPTASDPGKSTSESVSSSLSSFLNRRGSNASNVSDKSASAAPQQSQFRPQPPPPRPADIPARPPPPTSSSSGAPRPVSPIKSVKYIKLPLRIKIISLGNDGVGKSCIIKRFCEGRFVSRYISTIGLDYGVKQVNLAVDGGAQMSAKVNFFDLSGLDVFRQVRAEYYDCSQGVLLCFDVTNRQSFEHLEDWIKEAAANGLQLSSKGKAGAQPQSVLNQKPPFVVLMANKVDNPARAVTRQEGQFYASTHGFEYVETSAQTGLGISEAMQTLVKRVVTHVGAVRQGQVLSGMSSTSSMSMGGTKLSMFPV